MQEIKSPSYYFSAPRPWVFLAGSIEMGAAADWQQQAKAELADIPGTLLNPRRDEWDSSWEQSITNPQFREQVEWELTALACADVILMHIDPETKSPITLLEFGLYATSGKLIVSCPPGFWRRGNLEVTCAYPSIGLHLHDSLEAALATMRGRLAAPKLVA